MGEIAVRGADPRLTALLQLPEPGGAPPPLLVCIHGGGCNARYFDLKGFSVAAAARQRGYAVLLVDRPGHGRSAPPAGERPIAEAAALLGPFIAEVRAVHALEGGEVMLLGHSIGGAAAIMAAGRSGGAPIRALAVSGIGHRATPSAATWFEEVLAGSPPQPPASNFFGPEPTYDWRGPAALRRCGETWRRDDVVEVMGDWPRHFARLAATVRVPVQVRLAEHERIWDNSPAALGDIAAAFGAAPAVDIGLLADGGHLYEVHRRGPELVAAELDFFDRARRAPAA